MRQGRFAGDGATGSLRPLGLRTCASPRCASLTRCCGLLLWLCREQEPRGLLFPSQTTQWHAHRLDEREKQLYPPLPPFKMPTQIITPPAEHKFSLTQNLSAADQIFEAVFPRSPNFRIDLPYDEALGFIRRIDSYNEFEAAAVIEALEQVDKFIPRTSYGPGNSNNGRRDYTISVGREGSPVIYLERFEFATKRQMSESEMKSICLEMEAIGRADEAYCEVKEVSFCGPSRKIKFRFWWD